jgi:hypothetical protein
MVPIELMVHYHITSLIVGYACPFPGICRERFVQVIVRSKASFVPFGVVTLSNEEALEKSLSHSSIDCKPGS